ncbi:MAG: hypothetical protein NWR69_01445 [Flavobacteriales bacterium]|nr:hypothetical protein [Flavobacteriales bacterium]
MKNNPIKKYYWGIGLENETYLQFEESLIVSGQFIQEKMGRERYSIDYLKCYRAGSLEKVLARAFDSSKNYLVSQMMNSHSLEKLDIHFQHKTIQSAPPLLDNPDYAGKSILELFLEKQPFQIQSMLAQKNNPMGSIIFDGDTIEFVTKYYENRTIQESFNELKASKKIFLDKLNETKILPGPLTYPQYNIGINMFMSNQKKLVLFNNGTFHFHITLPTLTEDSRIVDYTAFDQAHHKAIYLLQWFEPLFIATLGSPDIMSVISDKYEMEEKFAGGSMRNAMSRYTGVGTYHKSMPKGKVLTFPVEEFRKLLNFQKEENIWWRDRIESELCYELLSDVGLDFNREKLYQSGYEFRSFDEFPTEYLPEVLHAIVLISEHAQHGEEIEWASNNVIWNNLVFKTLTQGYKTEMTEEEKNEIVRVFKLPASLQNELKDVHRLDEFFFQILQHLHDLHNDSSEYLKAFLYEKTEDAPRWENFNEHQVEQHTKQLEEVL